MQSHHYAPNILFEDTVYLRTLHQDCIRHDTACVFQVSFYPGTNRYLLTIRGPSSIQTHFIGLNLATPAVPIWEAEGWTSNGTGFVVSHAKNVTVNRVHDLRMTIPPMMKIPPAAVMDPVMPIDLTRSSRAGRIAPSDLRPAASPFVPARETFPQTIRAPFLDPNSFNRIQERTPAHPTVMTDLTTNATAQRQDSIPPPLPSFQQTPALSQPQLPARLLPLSPIPLSFVPFSQSPVRLPPPRLPISAQSPLAQNPATMQPAPSLQNDIPSLPSRRDENVPQRTKIPPPPPLHEFQHRTAHFLRRPPTDEVIITQLGAGASEPEVRGDGRGRGDRGGGRARGGRGRWTGAVRKG